MSTILMFDSCETQSCTNISIVSDLALENVESFTGEDHWSGQQDQAQPSEWRDCDR